MNQNGVVGFLDSSDEMRLQAFLDAIRLHARAIFLVMKRCNMLLALTRSSKLKEGMKTGEPETPMFTCPMRISTWMNERWTYGE
jgi:hypothetical protein